MKIPKTVKYAAFAIVLILLAIFLMRSCSLYDQVSVLKGKHEALQVAYADLDLRSRDLIAAYQADINAKDKAILEKDAEIGRIRGKIETQDKTIANLEAEYANLGEDKDGKIQNLLGQVAAWKEKFTLAQNIIAEKDSIIFDLSSKFESQVKISAEWEAQYHRQVELHGVCLERIKVMERGWRGLRFGSKVKTIIIGAVGAGLVYSLVKK